MKRILFLIVLLSVQGLYATNYVTVQSGSWNNPDIWEGGIVPPTNFDQGDVDKITIAEGHIVDAVPATLEVNHPDAELIIEGILRTKYCVSMKYSGILVVSGNLYVDVGGGVVPSGWISPLGLFTELNGQIVVEDGGFIGVNGRIKLTIGSATVKNNGDISTSLDKVYGLDADDVNGNPINTDVSLSEVLPIKLISFKVSLENNLAKFMWVTVVEINNGYFTIEQSTDLDNWYEIHNQLGSGNSFTERYYEVSKILHNTAPIIYFRLKQIDYDGKFTYSDPISVVVSKMKKEPVVNVSNGGVIIDGNYQVLSVYNVQGRLVAIYKNKSEIYDLPKGELLLYVFDNKYTQKVVL